MKTVRFVICMILLAVIFVSFCIVLSYTYFRRKSSLTTIQEKIKTICIVIMAASCVVAIILMAI